MTLKPKWLGRWPQSCALCERPLQDEPMFFDARIPRVGSWALICPRCFVAQGCRLGLGLGQAYDAQTLEKFGK